MRPSANAVKPQGYSTTSPIVDDAPTLFERGDERGQGVRNGSFSIKARRPVFSEFLLATGAAQVPIQIRTGVLGVRNTTRRELASW